MTQEVVATVQFPAHTWMTPVKVTVLHSQLDTCEGHCPPLTPGRHLWRSLSFTHTWTPVKVTVLHSHLNDTCESQGHTKKALLCLCFCFNLGTQMFYQHALFWGPRTSFMYASLLLCNLLAFCGQMASSFIHPYVNQLWLQNIWPLCITYTPAFWSFLGSLKYARLFPLPGASQ